MVTDGKPRVDIDRFRISPSGQVVARDAPMAGRPGVRLDASEERLAASDGYDWRVALSRVSQCPQRQDALRDQLMDMYCIAIRFGLYDAADYLRRRFGHEDFE